MLATLILIMLWNETYRANAIFHLLLHVTRIVRQDALTEYKTHQSQIPDKKKPALDMCVLCIPSAVGHSACSHCVTIIYLKTLIEFHIFILISNLQLR